MNEHATRVAEAATRLGSARTLREVLREVHEAIAALEASILTLEAPRDHVRVLKHLRDAVTAQFIATREEGE